MATRRRQGAIELQVSSLVRQLREAPDPVPGLGVFAVQAKKLAMVLDSAGTEFLATAAVSRELRELVKAMTAKEEAPGDPGAPGTRELLARLSAPLGHTAN